MSLQPIVRKDLGGQQIVYNPNSKTVRFSILTPFMMAGHKLNWDITKFGSVGLGINHSILKFLERTKSTLIVHIDSDNYDCVIKYDDLSKFIKHNNNEWRTGNQFIHVIPLQLCRGIQETKH